jgi:hypothetical protein
MNEQFWRGPKPEEFYNKRRCWPSSVQTQMIVSNQEMKDQVWLHVETKKEKVIIF